nr:MAG TPA: hypothetical protein [Caudoviricetes sp.]
MHGSMIITPAPSMLLASCRRDTSGTCWCP